MAKRNNIWVGPHKDGWQVKKEGNEKPSRVVLTQKEAIDIGKIQAKNNKSELIIQRGNGQIRERNSY